MIYNIYLIYLNLILNYSYRLVDVWLLGWAGCVGGGLSGAGGWRARWAVGLGLRVGGGLKQIIIAINLLVAGCWAGLVRGGLVVGGGAFAGALSHWVGLADGGE